MPPFTFNLCQNGNFFGSFHFGFSSCRHFVDSLSPSFRMGSVLALTYFPGAVAFHSSACRGLAVFVRKAPFRASQKR